MVKRNLLIMQKWEKLNVRNSWKVKGSEGFYTWKKTFHHSNTSLSCKCKYHIKVSAHPSRPGLVPRITADPALAPVADLVPLKAAAVCLRVVIISRGGEAESPGWEPRWRLHQATMSPPLSDQSEQTKQQTPGSKHCGQIYLRWCKM